MYKLVLHERAANDLRVLVKAGGEVRRDALRVLAYIEELQGRQDWLAQLLVRKSERAEFDIDKIISFWEDGRGVWRIKVFHIDFTAHKRWQIPYRLIYAYDETCSTFYILGVMYRKIDYDPEHEFTKRIRRTYDELGLPQHHITAKHTYGGNKRQ
jgi:mRNA-degrading endonuclease RelE of RelBE toxin-antitoxin system